MMDYANKIKDILLRDYFDEKEGWQLAAHTIKKNNGIVLSGISIKSENEKAVATIYVNEYREEGFSEEAAAEAIFQSYRERREESFEINKSNLLNQLTSFPDMKDFICYKLVNRKANQGLFQDVPHLNVNDDLSVVYYLQLESGATAVITNQMLDVWNITGEDVGNYLWKIAEKNTMKENPPVFKALIDILLEETPQEFREMIKDSISDNMTEIYVLTNENKVYGASTLLYEKGKVLQDCMKTMGCQGMYILPSSIHEVILVPDSTEMDKNEMMQMVQEVNRTQVAPVDVLSDNVFYFSDDTGLQQLTYTQRELAR